VPPDTSQNKTEAPTPRRRREARREGQVAYSRDVSSALLLLIGTAVIWLCGPAAALMAVRALHEAVGMMSHPQQAEPYALIQRLATAVGGSTALMLTLLFAVGLCADLAQVGFGLSPSLLVPRPERLSPVRGWERIVSGWWLRLMLGLLKAVAVAVVVVWLSVLFLRGRMGWWLGPEAVATLGWQLLLRIFAAAGGVLLLLALADYVYRRWRHEQELRMTRQELKEELKREEGDPLVRARVRSLQREYARRRMLEDVVDATVVVTNPTHVAVALKYERGAMPAPVVVAKGVDHLAQRIIERARAANVPVVRRPDLARQLYRYVRVGQEIPVFLYVAVAQVLAFVYKLRRSSGQAG